MEEVLWCWGALMVTLSVIYLEFKAHLNSMATTAFCSDTPSHLVWFWWDYHLIFNRTMTQHTSRLENDYFTKESDGATADDLSSTIPRSQPNEMVWDELNRIVKEKQLTSAQHMWELLQEC